MIMVIMVNNIIRVYNAEGPLRPASQPTTGFRSRTRRNNNDDSNSGPAGRRRRRPVAAFGSFSRGAAKSRCATAAAAVRCNRD